ARANAAINERQLNIVERSRAREQVECLKDEADFLVSYTRQFVIIHLRYVLAVQPILTLRSRVETPNQVHQRGFASARRANDCDVLDFVNIKRNTMKRVHFLSSHLVCLPDVPHRNQCERITPAVVSLFLLKDSFSNCGCKSNVTHLALGPVSIGVSA